MNKGIRHWDTDIVTAANDNAFLVLNGYIIGIKHMQRRGSDGCDEPSTLTVDENVSEIFFLQTVDVFRVIDFFEQSHSVQM
jgi:hypothetical protein